MNSNNVFLKKSFGSDDLQIITKDESFEAFKAFSSWVSDNTVWHNEVVSEFSGKLDESVSCFKTNTSIYWILNINATAKYDFKDAIIKIEDPEDDFK